MELSPKHELFVQSVIKHKGHLSLAYKEVYKCENNESARHGGSDLWRKMEIRMRFSELLEAQGLGASELLKKLKELTEATRIVRRPDAIGIQPIYGVQLEALRLAFYLHGFGKKQQIELNLSTDQMAQIAKMAKEFEALNQQSQERAR